MTNKTPQRITDRNNLHSARKALLAWQLDAFYVRLEGKCSGCGRSGGFVSYQLPEDLGIRREDNTEPAAFYCVHCEFTAAGTRKVEE